MDDLLGFLCGASIVLAIIAAVGHGIWLTVAWLFRHLTGSAPTEQGTRCEVCHAPRGVVGERCRRCGAPAEVSEEMRERADIFATRRQLNRWAAQGKLRLEEFQYLVKICDSPLNSVTTDATAQVQTSATAGTTSHPRADVLGRPLSPISPFGQEPVIAPVAAPGSAASAHAASENAASANAPSAPASSAMSISEDVVAAEIIDYVITDTHPLDRVETMPVAAPRPSAPRRAFADVLQAFMEQRNIRWIELISGLLIVGCATGLVVSLRAALRDKIPYFPALSFMLVTAAFHAAGIYSLRRWNLKSTSRGVLIIATLLVPLSILAAIFLSGEGETRRAISDPIFILAVLIGVVGFSAMNYFAARALIRHGWWRLMVAVLGASFCQILVERFDVHSGSAMAAASVVPALLAYLVANSALLYSLRRRAALGRKAAQQLFLELGIGTFAFLAPVGLFVARADVPAQAIRDASPVLSLAAAAMLAAGLMVHRRVIDPRWIGYRTAGSAVAVMAGLLMLMFVGFAWPDLRLIIAVGLLNFLSLLALAVIGELPILHGLSAASFTLAYLGVFLAARGLPRVAGPGVGRQLMQAALSGSTSLALIVLATVFGAVGTVLSVTKKRHDTGLAYLICAAAVGAISAAIAIYSGYWINQADGDFATIVLGYLAVTCLVAAWIAKRPEAGWIGTTLLLGATVHGCWLNDWVGSVVLSSTGLVLRQPLLFGFLLHSLFAAVIAAIAVWKLQLSGWRKAGDGEDEAGEKNIARQLSLISPLTWSAIGTSLIAVGLTLVVREHRYGHTSGYLAAVAGVWLIGAWILRQAWIWSGFQVFVTASLVFATASITTTRDWWTGWIWDARHLQLQLAVLGISCIVWHVMRLQFVRRYVPSWVLIADRLVRARGAFAVDQVLLVILVLACNAIAAVACLPGVARELGYTYEASGFFTTENVQRFVGVRTWLAMAAVGGAVGIAMTATRALSRLSLAVVWSAAVPALIAGAWFDASSTASAWRWTFAAFATAWFVPACYFGGPNRSTTRWSADVSRCKGPADVMRSHSLLIGTVVVVGLTTAVLLRVSAGEPVGLPAAGTFFARVSSAVSYATPLGLLATLFFVYAIRERRPAYALAASAVFQYFVSLACILPVLSAGQPLDSATAAKFLQWNLLGLSTFSAIWISCRRWIDAAEGRDRQAMFPFGPLTVQLAAMALVAFFIASWCTIEVIDDPVGKSAPIVILGSWTSYLGIAIGAGSITWLMRPDRTRMAEPWMATLFLFVPVFAASMHARDVAGMWWGYHTLTVGWTAVAAVAVAWMWWDARSVPLTAKSVESSAQRISLSCTVLAVVLASLAAITNLGDAPSHAAESAAAAATVVIAGALGIRTRKQRFAYASLFYAGVSCILFHSALPPGHPLRREMVLAPGFFSILFTTAFFWLLCEVWFQRHGQPGVSRRGVGAVHRFAAWSSIVLGMLVVILATLVILFSSQPMELRPAELAAFIGMLAALFALHFGLLWDRRGHYATLGLYMWLLLCGLFIVVQLDVPIATRRVTFIGVLAAQVAITGWIWSWGSKLAVLGSRFGMADPIESLRRTSRWLIGANLVLATETLLASTWFVVNFESRGLRVAAATLPVVLAGGIAGIAQQHRRLTLQIASLLVACWGAVLLGWSDISPDWTSASAIARAIRMLMALCVGGFALGVVGVRVISSTSTWKLAARYAAVILVGTASATLIATLLLEAAHFEPRIGAPVTAGQVAAVSIVLVGLIVTLISLAVLPGRDPFGLSERGRMTYVYAAQAMAALLFAHIYLARPTLFSGFLSPYWPYIIVLIAFIGIGVGAIFDRLGLKVLSEPFQRSGSFLPLIPAIGMWFIHSDSQYASVLFVIGLLYLALSFAQRSVWARAAAAVAGNGALWAFLGGEDNLTFAQHPQFWLIPPAISVMIAAQLQKHRLSDVQIAGIRYAAMIVIYASSSIEMMKIGIGESLWPPVILICLSLAGVALGIALRIRAYLYLGAAFVLVSLFSMVAHASRSIDHVWPWWAFGIALGVAILVLFGYFESRRTQMLALVERLRQWEK